MPKPEIKQTAIGGSAVIEGVMMRGPSKTALSVRSPEGAIKTEIEDNRPAPRAAKWPLVRGVVNFAISVSGSFRAILRSAELAGLDAGEKGKFELYLEKRFGKSAMRVLSPFVAVLSVALSLGLLVVLPSLFCDLFAMPAGLRPAAEGVLKLVIFALYLALVSRMKEMRRVFAYHGAEHKAIAAYEAGEALTVESARGHSRFHRRCGTSFIFIVLIVSVAVFAAVNAPTWGLRIGLKIALTPVIVGLAYEVIRFAGRRDNALTRALSAPGLAMQRLTTREPDDGQLEVALASLRAVLPEAGEDDRW